MAVLFLATPLLALDDPPLRNWAVPSASSGSHLSTLSDIGGPVVFVAMAPCRIMDTRGGAPLGGGVGPFTNGVTRSYGLSSAAAPCNGIPAGATAYSINTTVTNHTGTGYVAVYPKGNAPSPMVSLLNYTAASGAIANATIVPCNSLGEITVLDAGGTTDIFIDINGYFTSSPNTGESFSISATADGAAAVVGYNSSNVDGSHGVGGYEGGTGKVYGVQGQIGASAGAGSSGVHGIGAATTTTTYAVTGETTSTGSGSAAVFGDATAGTGSTYGVVGRTASIGVFAAGVGGIATNASANAGYFTNPGTGAGVVTYIGTTADPGAPAPSGMLNYGAWVIGGNIYASGGIYGSTKSFVAPHPTDPSKEIVYMSVEAPSADIYFRGTAHLVSGVATIEVPEHFRVSARPDSYQTNLTVVGGRGSVWVESEGPQGIVIRGTGDTVHYMVYAERDAIERQLPVRENVHFNAAALARGDVRSLP